MVRSVLADFIFYVHSHHLYDSVIGPHDPWTTHSSSDISEENMRGIKEGDGGVGVVIMDMVGEGGDWDLVRLIISLNMGILWKVQQG